MKLKVHALHYITKFRITLEVVFNRHSIHNTFVHTSLGRVHEYPTKGRTPYSADKCFTKKKKMLIKTYHKYH